jgi:hypothetical protein
MTKKFYISPEIEKLECNISNLLIGTGQQPPDDDIIGGEDIGAKGWGGDFFNADEDEE